MSLAEMSLPPHAPVAVWQIANLGSGNFLILPWTTTTAKAGKPSRGVAGHTSYDK
jgi:hypothetical protein